MKSIKRILIMLLAITPILFGLTGCNFLAESPKSAYDIAVEHGFKGSEEEWLESLKGADGKDGDNLDIKEIYQAACESGYDGTILDFIATYFKDAKINGKSAYEVAVENGFKGSEAEWLESLKGDAGLNGSDGKPGDVDLYQVYLKLLEDGAITGSYLEFVQNYLNVNFTPSYEEGIAKAMQSSVRIMAFNVPIEDVSTSKDAVGQGGSGVIYKLNKKAGSAYIITNYHVCYNEYEKNILSDIYVFTYGQEVLSKAMKAKYIGGSATYDIAILEVKNDVLKTSPVRAIDYVNSNDIVVGTTAIAIGNPKNDGISVTKGIVSVDSEIIEMTPIKNDPSVVVNSKGKTEMRVMRIDTAVNGGNSGGGLYNGKGELMGIVNAKIVSKEVENMSYAIPANVALGVADNILSQYDSSHKTNLNVYRPMLGITVRSINSKAVYDEKTKLMHIEEEIQVTAVEANSAAYNKLRADDLLKSITVNGEEIPVNRMFVIPDSLLRAKKGDKIKVKVLRGEELVEVEITIDKTVLCG